MLLYILNAVLYDTSESYRQDRSINCSCNEVGLKFRNFCNAVFYYEYRGRNIWYFSYIPLFGTALWKNFCSAESFWKCSHFELKLFRVLGYTVYINVLFRSNCMEFNTTDFFGSEVFHIDTRLLCAWFAIILNIPWILDHVRKFIFLLKFSYWSVSLKKLRSSKNYTDRRKNIGDINLFISKYMLHFFNDISFTKTCLKRFAIVSVMALSNTITKTCV